MRAVLHQDIVALATCLLKQPSAKRSKFAAIMVAQAHNADLFRLHHGRAHYQFGDGTLASCCSRENALSERRLDDPDYAECMIKAIEAVAAFRHSQSASDRHHR